MPYRCVNPENFLRKLWGTGQCVDLVKIACHAPATSGWKEGDKVKGNASLQKGTAIATFQGGTYNNRTNGDSHAAIYLRQTNHEIFVIDQWAKQGFAAERSIRFKGQGEPRNDGDTYSVIE